MNVPRSVRGWPFLLLILVIVSLSSPASAEDDLYLGAALDWNTRYFWRGMTWSDGAVAQPSIWTSLFGYNLMVWANAPLGGASGRSGFDEVDVYLEGTSPRRSLAIVPGLNVYTYPRAEEESPWTAEIALTFYMPVGPVWLYLENNVDIRSYVGAYYAELGLQTGRDIAENLNLEASLAQGYASTEFNQAYLGIARSGFTYLTAHVGLGLRVGGVLTFTPHLETVFAIDNELLLGRSSPVCINFGLTVTLGQD